MRHQGQDYLRSTISKDSRVLSIDELQLLLDTPRKEMSIGERLHERIKILSLSDLTETWVLDFRNNTLSRGLSLLESQEMTSSQII